MFRVTHTVTEEGALTWSGEAWVHEKSRFRCTRWVTMERVFPPVGHSRGLKAIVLRKRTSEGTAFGDEGRAEGAGHQAHRGWGAGVLSQAVPSEHLARGCKASGTCARAVALRTSWPEEDALYQAQSGPEWTALSGWKSGAETGITTFVAMATCECFHCPISAGSSHLLSLCL